MWTRECPICLASISYSYRETFKTACQRNTSCGSCRAKNSARGRAAVSDATRRKMSLSRRGSNNSFYGRKHSIESKRLIGEKTKSRQTGACNPFFGQKHTRESRQKMSESRAKGIASGRIPNTNGYGRKGWYTSLKSSESFYYDSLLEKFRMIQLDHDDRILTWTKRHGLRIPYIWDGSSRNFIPDFLIHESDGTVVIEEIKGKDAKAAVKHAALLTHCKTRNIECRWIEQTVLEQQGYRKFVENQK